MRIFLALLGAPLLALIDQSMSFAAVSWSCAHESTLLMHLFHALFLAATVAAAFLVFGEWRRSLRVEAMVQINFLAALATASAILSALAIAAMWIPVWMVSSCIA